MGSKKNESELSLEAQQQIDTLCQAFERAWKTGDIPKLEEYVAKAPPPGRTKLLRELLIIELHYRGDGSRALGDSELCVLHPELMPEIAEQLKLLRDGVRSS